MKRRPTVLTRALLAHAAGIRGDIRIKRRSAVVAWEFLHQHCDPWPCYGHGPYGCAVIAESMALSEEYRP